MQLAKDVKTRALKGTTKQSYDNTKQMFSGRQNQVGDQLTLHPTTEQKRSKHPVQSVSLLSIF